MADPTVLKVVKPQTPAENIAGLLECVLKRAQEGEFATVYVAAIRPDGSWVTFDAGGDFGQGTELHPLTQIGILEDIKSGILDASRSAAE